MNERTTIAGGVYERLGCAPVWRRVSDTEDPMARNTGSGATAVQEKPPGGQPQEPGTPDGDPGQPATPPSETANAPAAIDGMPQPAPWRPWLGGHVTYEDPARGACPAMVAHIHDDKTVNLAVLLINGTWQGIGMIQRDPLDNQPIGEPEPKWTAGTWRRRW